MCDDQLPTKSDFMFYGGGLDEKTAWRQMGGKTKDEVRALLEDNYIHYQEDFMWMGPKAFCYYVDAMIDYIASTDDPDEMWNYVTNCDFRLGDRAADGMRPCANKVADSLDWVAKKMAQHDRERAALIGKTADAYRRLAHAGNER